MEPLEIEPVRIPRIAPRWPIIAVVLGSVLTLAWTAFLLWLIVKVVLQI